MRSSNKLLNSNEHVPADRALAAAGRGGKRAGAGRPAGSKNMRSAEIAQQAIEEGITPIEVMLSAMRELWEEGTPEAKQEAARIAKDAAPYVHPRLASIDQTVREATRFVIRAPEPCSAEEWQADVRAGKYGPYASNLLNEYQRKLVMSRR
jgi:hypothetical protein